MPIYNFVLAQWKAFRGLNLDLSDEVTIHLGKGEIAVSRKLLTTGIKPGTRRQGSHNSSKLPHAPNAARINECARAVRAIKTMWKSLSVGQ